MGENEGVGEGAASSEHPTVWPHNRELNLTFPVDLGTAQALIDNSLFGTYLIRDETFLHVNRRLEAIFGYEAGEIVRGTPVAQLVAKRDRALVADNLRRRLQGEVTDLHYEFRGRRKSGSTVSVEVFGRVIEHHGRPAVAGVLIDRTGQVRAERQLRRVNARLRAAIEERGRIEQQLLQIERVNVIGVMASGVAHNFRNMLAPIDGFAQILLQRASHWNLPSEVVEHLERIHGSARSALAEVEQLRAMYSPDPVSSAFQPVDLIQEIESAITITEPRWRMEASRSGASIECQTNFAELPEVHCRPGMIRSALVNLIFNAVDAMPDGGVITVTANRGTSEEVEISVADTGVGMSEETRMRCLEPFYTTKGSVGTGLGLAMVQLCVDQHHGRIEIDSTPGQGTTFTLTFPARS